MAVAIPAFDLHHKPDIQTIKDALDTYGCAVIHHIHSMEDVARVRAELSQPMESLPVATEDSPQDFYPANTRRLPALLARSTATHPLALNATIQELCQHHLGPNCERYQLHVSAALEIGPGAREQVLHREEDPFQFFPVPRPNMVIATMWAISDFTSANGATLLVPGSHRWPAERTARPEEIVHAEMPAGSVMVWLGGTLHAAGANTSNEWRYGIILTYSLAWLRQEENQYLDLPPAIAASMSKEIKALVGYPMHGSLGFYDPRIASGSE